MKRNTLVILSFILLLIFLVFTIRGKEYSISEVFIIAESKLNEFLNVYDKVDVKTINKNIFLL